MMDERYTNVKLIKKIISITANTCTLPKNICKQNTQIINEHMQLEKIQDSLAMDLEI